MTTFDVVLAASMVMQEGERLGMRQSAEQVESEATVVVVVVAVVVAVAGMKEKERRHCVARPLPQ